MKKNSYTFTSPRLGFRNWIESDIPKMIEISGNPEVMRFFPAIATPQQTTDFIRRLQNQFEEKGYCYFAVDELETQKFIGFIGFYYQDYESEITPATDIGWRLHPDFWGKGYGKEIAKGLINYCFQTLELTELTAYAVLGNKGSIKILEEEMDFKKEFTCKERGWDERVYKIKKEDWLKKQ